MTTKGPSLLVPQKKKLLHKLPDPVVREMEEGGDNNNSGVGVLQGESDEDSDEDKKEGDE